MRYLLLYFAGFLSTLLSFTLGEYLPLVLPYKNRVFSRKPFNCSPCTTFHLQWLISALIALIFNAWGILVIGIITAFILFFIVRYRDNNKVID